ncbi:MAG: ATP-dependent zinc metalloprotease FtsH [Clostridia bacterium]|nr:ATP-dependent zinc metalloprotease FtsH [Clostridia bacterium]
MKKSFKGISFYIILPIIIILLMNMSLGEPEKGVKSFSELVTAINNEKVEKLTIEDTVTKAVIDGKEYQVEVTPGILFEVAGEEIKSQIAEGKIKTSVPAPEDTAWWISLIPTVLMILVIGFFWFSFMKSQTGGHGIGSFGKSKAKSAIDSKINFDMVAGADEEKKELEEVVEFLKNPKKFIDLGARIPKGVLLVGPPGTGKTLLAKAVAGEAGVPFFSISGSDFVEMFVGVGASRVRDLFEQARKNLPAIIFIDEIDAVGRQRGAGLGGGHDEREQTLNQLLVEMDGFGTNEGVIIIAATNRPDILDPALLRPGRFDRQIVVNYPDQKGREAILKVHSKNKPVSDTVSLETVSKSTYGFTGADLENLLNEAAILTARRDKKLIEQEEIDEAILKVIMGPEKKNRKHNELNKKKTAYHEAGHAVAAKLLPTQDNVHQVSIIPRGRAGGFTLSLPDTDKSYISKEEMLEQIIMSLAGRAAEKIVFNEINSGASSDLDHVTKTARKMVMQYGMSEKLGYITFTGEDHEVFLGRDFSQGRNYSESVASVIDEEIKRIVDECYAKCEKLLTDNRDKLDNVANALIKYEKLDAAEFEEVFEKGELSSNGVKTEDPAINTENKSDTEESKE